METKACKSCGMVKPATTEFFNKKLDGLCAVCRECRAAARRQDTAAKDRANSLRRQKRQTDPDEVRAKERARYGPKKLDGVRRWRKANPEAKAAADRRYYEKNREKCIARAVERNRANPEAARRSLRLIHQRKQAKDPGYRLARSIKSQVYQALTTQKRGRRWVELVGYDVEALRSHLERQFLRGMSWDNYGEWHVDHIRPASSFEFSTPEDKAFRECWALTNLRPMWATDNIKKGARRLHLL